MHFVKATVTTADGVTREFKAPMNSFILNFDHDICADRVAAYSLQFMISNADRDGLKALRDREYRLDVHDPVNS
jgi:hypothetical protein